MGTPDLLRGGPAETSAVEAVPGVADPESALRPPVDPVTALNEILSSAVPDRARGAASPSQANNERGTWDPGRLQTDGVLRALRARRQRLTARSN